MRLRLSSTEWLICSDQDQSEGPAQKQIFGAFGLRVVGRSQSLTALL
jgi:hypothetical protein